MKKLAMAVAAMMVLSACHKNKNLGEGNESNYSSAQWEEMREQGRVVFFAYDSSKLDDYSQNALKKQAENIKSHPDAKFVIEGHCDERGTVEYNLALGERRASAVKKYLESLGVSGSSLSTISYGKERPAMLGSTEEAYAKNRRAEVVGQ
jgi:peptidoglycan-associated lipoprotein